MSEPVTAALIVLPAEWMMLGVGSVAASFGLIYVEDIPPEHDGRLFGISPTPASTWSPTGPACAAGTGPWCAGTRRRRREPPRREPPPDMRLPAPTADREETRARV